jgi:glycosyltransferase involved in cell wall biosynthesis
MDRYRKMMNNPERFTVYDEYVPDEKRAQLFRQASVVVLPYTEATQSGVIPVAYSFSKPVVATAVGGIPSQVENGVTGYLVPPRDEKALAGAIVRLLLDRNLRYMLGGNAKRKVTAEASPEVVARDTVAVYLLGTVA